MIVVLWRAGLRIQEARALSEHDLDHRRGSILIRSGKGGRRREVGMDEWGWEQLRPWLNARAELPVGPAVLHHRRPHPRATVVRRRRSHRAPPTGRRRRRQAALRPPPAAPRACHRTGPRGRAAEHHPTTARPHQPRHDVDLPARDRPRGDHRHRPMRRAPMMSQRRCATLSHFQRERAGAPAHP